jgi:hypothetical protein
VNRPVAVNRLESCTVATCHESCALEVVDRLLQATGSVRGEEVDALLDLRWLLHRREDAEATLALFCKLRLAMEERHYLSFYRLRRWLENHLLLSIRPPGETRAHAVPVKLDRYCPEAVRARCLYCGLSRGELTGAGRASFVFRPGSMRSVPAQAAASAA